MGSFGAVVRMVGRRGLGHWRLLLTLITGVVLSAGLMASVFLYSDAIRDLGLRHALETKPAVALDIRIRTSARATPTDFDNRRQAVDALLHAYANDITRQIVHSGTSATFFLTPPGDPVPVPETRPRAQLQFQEGFADHTRIVDGRAPGPKLAPEPGKPPQLDVLLGKASADALGVQLGQTFDLHPFWKPQAAPVVVTVVGFVEPQDPNEEYWAGATDRFRVATTGWPTYPFFVEESTLARLVGGYLPDMDISLETLAMVDIGRINSQNAQGIENRLRALDADLTAKVQYARMESAAPATIKNYREKLFFTRLPLFVVMIQVVGIVLYYLVMVASMVVERQAGEIALLKSRGASTWQVLAVFAIEAFGLCASAIIAGPLIAVGAISLLGLTPPFHDLSGGDLLRVPLSTGAVALAALGALLAFVAMLWPAYRACRHSITHYKQEISRPPTQPAFLRYYLDLVVIGAGALAFYQLRQHGSLATESLFGGLSADPVLLATPSLLILLTALVFLRLFPLALRLVAWLTSTLSGATISVALTHMVRSPIQHSRLILLLILTTAVGVFAAGFRATLEQGYQDRAAYEAGAEVRIEDIRKPASVPLEPFMDAVRNATGSQRFTPVARQNASVSIDRFGSASVAVLGIQPDFPDFAAWRDDFADTSLNELVQRLAQPPVTLPAPPAIPPGSRFMGIWAQVPLAQTAAAIGVRLRGANGVIWEYRLSPEKTPTIGAWAFYSVDLARASFARPDGAASNVERRIDSVFVRLPGTQPQVSEQMVVSFDDLQVSADPVLAPGWGANGFPGGTVLEPFDDLSRYELITGVSAVANPGQVTRGTASGDRTGNVARLAFTRGGRAGAGTAGLRRQTDQRPLPVVADAGFMVEAKKKTGDEFLMYANSQYVKVRVVGTFSLFPTFDPSKRRHVFLTDLTSFQDAASRAPSGIDAIFPNEAWMADRGAVLLTRESLAARGLNAEKVVDRAALLEAQAADPLIAASWQGILFICFAAVLLLSALGFVTHSGLSAQARSLEFAILRTMGMSGKQIIGVVSFEQCFVIAAGVAAGTLLGFPLSRLMIDSMGINEQGATALPPLLSRVGWSAIITVYTLLGIVVATTVAVLVLLYSRLAVSRALRMGEL